MKDKCLQLQRSEVSFAMTLVKLVGNFVGGEKEHYKKNIVFRRPKTDANESKLTKKCQIYVGQALEEKDVETKCFFRQTVQAMQFVWVKPRRKSDVNVIGKFDVKSK